VATAEERALGHGYTDHLIDFMDAMSLDRPIVSGVSLGG